MNKDQWLGTAYSILQQNGFKNINYFASPFDLQAEKDDIIYDVMVEIGENPIIQIAWKKLKELIETCVKYKNHKGLLILFNGDNGGCLFEMLDGRSPPTYYRPWFS